ncbi:MAG TPA: hypothetical protein VN937_02310 [Blastocatellia bacterium]|nr:hypothetical protein [Blastocatellia bacterium]
MKLYVTRFVILFTFALLLLNLSLQASFVSAQQKAPAKPDCPVTKVTCPDTVYINDKLEMTANVSGGDSNVTPTYNWSVSAGTIESGQGTSTIAISTKDLSDSESVTATVDVGGFSRDCGYGQTAASCTTSVMKKAEARKLDEYGKLLLKDENERLDKFTMELQMDPTAQAYIIAYGGRLSRAGDAQKLADKAKVYLVTKRGVDRDRIVTIDGGHREQPAVELWLVPSRASLPKPTPTVKK